MSILRIKKGAEINLFLGRSRKKSERKERKKDISCEWTERQRVQKKIFPCELARKKSERKYRKGFSLLRSGEKENTEKDFSTLSIQKKE